MQPLKLEDKERLDANAAFERVTQARQVDRVSILPRLLKRPDLLPGESLSSYVARLAQANYYEPPSLLLSLILGEKPSPSASRSRGHSEKVWPQRHYDNLQWPTGLETYSRLAALTGLAPARFYEATTHTYANVLVPPEAKLYFLEGLDSVADGGGVSAPRRLFAGRDTLALRPDTQAQYYPQCLAETGYHRLIWSLWAVSACLVHHCLLIDRCHQCRSVLCVNMIAVGRCGQCKSDLLEASALLLTEDESGLLAQKAIQSWFEPIPQSTSRTAGLRTGDEDKVSETVAENAQTARTNQKSNPLNHSENLTSQAANVLFYVLEGLKAAVLAMEESWPYFHQPDLVNMTSNASSASPLVNNPLISRSSYQQFCLYATAYKGLANWPEGFDAFLSACRQQNYRAHEIKSYGPLRAELGIIYENWLLRRWKHPAYRFVQTAFEDYLVKHFSLNYGVVYSQLCRHNSRLVQLFAYINLEEAARLLKMAPVQVENLAEAGLLKTYQSADTYRKAGQVYHYQLFNRSEVTRLVREGKAGDYQGLFELAAVLRVNDLPAFLKKAATQWS